ncbi:hypothetical protein VCHA50O413_40218 [Vibrio chagasii]|nr:hypothetical protein VCHA34P131_100121 [Vibrio chagasii]CAH6805096.1 hypothetical protein VCHA29O39_110111 [Vibrio chagasii]CAH6807174.1 hypothetical protein VCHA36O157_130021 [Vibrio chagasii]CAH6820800.1 hypothetical protein VCHA35P150_140021 [Vibrio chagasii]CAH6824365.1 hypothetical protein VCHA34P112_160118 [Vibrio chagasii]
MEVIFGQERVSNHDLTYLGAIVSGYVDGGDLILGDSIEHYRRVHANRAPPSPGRFRCGIIAQCHRTKRREY